jgi:branched-subunit amino acid transport protein
MNYSNLEIWGIIVLLALGTFLLRFSFLGILGNRDLPPWVLRHLRYTAVAVMPGLIAPLILFPAATGGQLDPIRLIAALSTLALGLYTKSVLIAVFGGATLLLVLHYSLT